MRLALIIALVLALGGLGCAANPSPQPQGPEVFAAPQARTPVQGGWGESLGWLGSLVLGLAWGWMLAWWWRRRQAAQELEPGGPVPPGDLGRLQAVARRLDDLALAWRRQRKVKPLRRDQPPPRL